MSLNELEQMDISGLSVEAVMNLEEKELDMLLENIRIKIERNMINLERRLKDYEKMG